MRIAILDNDPQQRALIADALGAAQHDCAVFSRIEHLVSGLRDAAMPGKAGTCHGFLTIGMRAGGPKVCPTEACP